MEALIAYLEETDPDYQKGVELLATVSRNRTLLNLLRGKENSQLTEKLRFELARYAARPELAALPTLAAQVADETELTPPENAGDPPAEDAGSIADLLATLSPEVQDEIGEIIVLQQRIFNRQVVLSNSLADQLSDEARRQVVEEQETLEQQYNALAQKKGLLTSTGQLPAAPPPAADEKPPLDAAQLKDQQLRLRSARSKAKSAINLARSPEKKVAAEVKYAQLEGELNQIDLQLKALANNG